MTTTPEPGAPAADEFFVGYLTTVPAGVKRRVRIFVIPAFVAVLGLTAIVAAAFFRPAAASWSDVPAEFTGRILETPCPLLRAPAPGGNAGGGIVRLYLLVASGKHGAAAKIAGLDGRIARVRGTVLEREGRALIEISDDEDAVASIPDQAGSPAPAQRRPLGRRTLSGEIVDIKCFCGAMKPGEGKLHKACAIRCIDGGIPPMLVSTPREAAGGAGTVTFCLLAASEGLIARRVIPFVAEPVTVTGTAEEVDGLIVLTIDNAPGSILRR